MSPPAKRPRAVVLVGNPVNPYSRAIRIGRSLTEQGYEVEIAATTEPGAPLEQRDGDLVIRRYPPRGIFARLADAYRWQAPTPPAAPTPSAAPAAPAAPAAAPTGATANPPTPPPAARRRAPLRTRIVRAIRTGPLSWFLWPHTVRGWWATLSKELAPADLYHSCGTLPIAAALAAARRDRRAGRAPKVILDVIDISLESNNVLGMPAIFRLLLDRRERRWARAADGHAAVNDALADKAVARWHLARRPTVVPNYPEPPQGAAGAPGPDRIRAATGLPPTTRICLFWGRLGPYVGLDEAAVAVLAVPDAALVVLGFGRGWAASTARDADPRHFGRHFTLPAVHPDELLAWVASADVALCTLPPLSFNQRHATPNKFLEAMAAGTPIVLGPDLPVMAEILEREDLGRVAASMAPADIAAAIRSIVDLPNEERAAWRQRIAATSRAHYTWPVAAAAYRALVDQVRAR